MPTLPQRTTSNTAAEHVADHNALHPRYNTPLFNDATDVNFTAADKAIPVWDAGQGLLVAGAYASILVRRTTDATARNNTATLADDDVLTVALLANTLYFVEGRIFYTGTGTADIKHAWTYPAAASVDIATGGLAVGAAGPSGSTYVLVNDAASGTAFSTGIGASTSKFFIPFAGFVEMGVNAGSLTFQWAQQTAEVSDLIVKKNSHMFVTRMG